MSGYSGCRSKDSSFNTSIDNNVFGDIQEQQSQVLEEDLLYEEQQLQQYLLSVYEEKNVESEKSLQSEIITTTSSSSSFVEEKTKSIDHISKGRAIRKWRQPKLDKNHIKHFGKIRYRAKVCEHQKPGCDKKSSLDSINEFYCLYVTSVESNKLVTIDKFESAIKDIVSEYKLKDACCGIIAIFTDKADFDKVLQLDLKNIFGVPIQVGNLCSNEKRYRNFVTFKNIPWCISNQELSNALKQQGIHFGKLNRLKNNVRVEVFNSCHLERLLQEGLNFYNCVTFSAIAEGINDNYNNDVIQCYKCQGFWHTANHCRHTARCVRCGENHDVDFCSRPKNNAVCCNCGGPHHAAYKNCPIKLQLMNSAKVAFSLACKPRNPSFSN